MPAYRYQCVQCQAQEIRIGGVDDHVAICIACGHLMLRLDLDLFAPYFATEPDLGESEDVQTQHS